MPAPKKLETAFYEKVSQDPNSGCWLWTASCNKHGYGRLRNKGRNLAAHRVAWELCRGPVPDGLCVLHKCDVPMCCNPDHLFLGTRKDNGADMAAKGRGNFQKHPETRPRGERHKRHKLSERDVLKIRAAVGNCYALSKAFGISMTQIQRIKAGESWAHLTNTLVPLAGRSEEKTARGEKINTAKLTPTLVIKIRTDQRPKSVIAAEYGVTQAAIYAIKKRLSWRHIP